MSAPRVIEVSNRAGTLRVRVSEFGQPLEIRASSLRCGADAFARQVLRLCELGAARGAALRRAELSADGVPETLLDRLEARR